MESGGGVRWWVELGDICCGAWCLSSCSHITPHGNVKHVKSSLCRTYSILSSLLHACSLTTVRTRDGTWCGQPCCTRPPTPGHRLQVHLCRTVSAFTHMSLSVGHSIWEMKWSPSADDRIVNSYVTLHVTYCDCGNLSPLT